MKYISFYLFHIIIASTDLMGKRIFTIIPKTLSVPGAKTHQINVRAPQKKTVKCKLFTASTTFSSLYFMIERNTLIFQGCKISLLVFHKSWSRFSHQLHALFYFMPEACQLGRERVNFGLGCLSLTPRLARYA